MTDRAQTQILFGKFCLSLETKHLGGADSPENKGGRGKGGRGRGGKGRKQGRGVQIW